jgi:hypothetical protein
VHLLGEAGEDPGIDRIGLQALSQRVRHALIRLGGVPTNPFPRGGPVERQIF